MKFINNNCSKKKIFFWMYKLYIVFKFWNVYWYMYYIFLIIVEYIYILNIF